MRRTIILGLAGVLAAACSSQAARSGAGGSAVPATSPASTTPASAATGASAFAACTGRDLTIRAVRGSGASQHAALMLVYTNVSSASCSVRGYPEVALLLRNGVTFALAKQSTKGFMCGIGGGCPGAVAVRLAPGLEAAALFEWMDANDAYAGADNAAACPDFGVTAIRFTLPGANETALARTTAKTVDMPVCGDAIVHAVTSVTGPGY